MGYLKQRRRIIRQVRTPVLSEVPYELSMMRTRRVQRSPQQFIPAGSPHDQPPEGTEDSASPSPYRTWFVPGLLRAFKSPLCLSSCLSELLRQTSSRLNKQVRLISQKTPGLGECYARFTAEQKRLIFTKKTYTIFVCSKIRMIENNKAETT